MINYELIKCATAFSTVLELLDEEGLKFVADEVEKTFSKEECEKISNILDILDEEVELKTLIKEFIQDLKKFFN